jgi:hypothetical protein
VTRVDPQAVQDAAGTFVAARLGAAGLGRASTRAPVREREQRRAARAAGDRGRPPGRPKRRRLAFDGKVLRAARRGGKRVNLLAAACHDTGAVTAQRVVDGKSNEIPDYAP